LIGYYQSQTQQPLPPHWWHLGLLEQSSCAVVAEEAAFFAAFSALYE
jgi:hypothetical protein